MAVTLTRQTAGLGWGDLGEEGQGQERGETRFCIMYLHMIHIQDN